jgi:predicted transcriptional regulator
MQITIELSDEQSQRLRSLAESLRVAPTDLGQAAVEDLLTQPQSDFRHAAEYVLAKNRELYKRLA